MCDSNNSEKIVHHTDRLASSSDTKISPNTSNESLSIIDGAEVAFNEFCEKLKRPIQMVRKKAIEWKKNDPLRFWQSLSFSLRSEELTCVAVSSFVDNMGRIKLYIASNSSMTPSQQQQVTEIINMFLDLKPVNDIIAKLLPRHFPYVVKQFDKIVRPELNALLKEYPGNLANKTEELYYKRFRSQDDFEALLPLIVENKKVLCEMKDGTGEGTSEAASKIANHLCKMVRLGEAICFVWKKVKRHQEDPSLKFLSRHYQFISLNCHAELAILKTAMDCCDSRTLYIGVSKRPCYCCSQLFKAVEQNKPMKFNISIVTTHGKMYGKWNKIGEGYFEKEFNQVWTKVIQQAHASCREKEEEPI